MTRFLALVSVLFLVSRPADLSAQPDLPLTVSAGTHALTVPWYPGPLLRGSDPVFMIGTDHGERARGRGGFFFAVNLGFFRDRWWMSGVSLEPEVGFGGRVAGGLRADVRIGLGYLHYFWRRQMLRMENGRYVPVSDLGHPSLILPLSLTLGYRGPPEDPWSLSPTVTARWGIQGLFLPDLPIMTHLSLLGGVRIRRGDGRTGGGGVP